VTKYKKNHCIIWNDSLLLFSYLSVKFLAQSALKVKSECQFKQMRMRNNWNSYIGNVGRSLLLVKNLRQADLYSPGIESKDKHTNKLKLFVDVITILYAWLRVQIGWWYLYGACVTFVSFDLKNEDEAYVLDFWWNNKKYASY